MIYYILYIIYIIYNIQKCCLFYFVIIFIIFCVVLSYNFFDYFMYYLNELIHTTCKATQRCRGLYDDIIIFIRCEYVHQTVYGGENIPQQKIVSDSYLLITPRFAYSFFLSLLPIIAFLINLVAFLLSSRSGDWRLLTTSSGFTCTVSTNMVLRTAQANLPSSGSEIHRKLVQTQGRRVEFDNQNALRAQRIISFCVVLVLTRAGHCAGGARTHGTRAPHMQLIALQITH